MLNNTQVDILTKNKMLEDEVLEGILHDYVSENYLNKYNYYEKAYNKAYQKNNVRYFLAKLVQHGIYDKHIEELLIDFTYKI